MKRAKGTGDLRDIISLVQGPWRIVVEPAHAEAVASAFLARPNPDDGATHDWATMHPDDQTYWLDTVNYIITKHEELSR